MEVTSIPTVFDQIIIPLIIAIIAAFCGALFERFLSRKKKELGEGANIEIQDTHKGIIGELRQGDRSRVVIVNNPTYALGAMQRTKPVAILKRDSKTESILRPSERRKEIGGIKFTYIRDLTDKVLEPITWLPEPFDQALRASIAYYTSNTPIDSGKYSKDMLAFLQEMKEIHENDRLAHLIIPRIMLVDETNISSVYKWTLLKEYYNGVKENGGELGNMIFIGSKDPNIYVDKLLFDYHETRKLGHIIMEARGSNINNAAKVAIRVINENLPYWFITRTDFCLHSFEEISHAAKIWVEMTKAKDKELSDYQETQKKTRGFIDFLMKQSSIKIEGSYTEKAERIEIYERILGDLDKYGFAVLFGEDKSISDTLFLASVFRYHNPRWDYAADLDEVVEDGSSLRVVVIFGSEDISSIYQRFEEKYLS
jgi:DNA-binding protein